MVQSDRPPANGFVARARKVYNPIGFSKGYNFVLWFIFLGALLGFTLARLQYLDIWGVFCGDQGSSGALPGECFYYTRPGPDQIGIILHLGCILPASLLACVQFIPVIRHKAIIVHRINGWLVLLLSVIATVGAFLMARNSVGGGIDVQMGIGVIGIMFVASLILAVVNVKRLQIEQHRAWMLRAWFYAGTIITMRIILILSAMIISSIGGYYHTQPCDKLEYMLGSANATRSLYPECASYFSGANPAQQAVVAANFNGNVAEIGSSFNATFGPAFWLAFALHAVGIEIYLHLTPAEAERLRNVSYQRQVEAGMRYPGRAGLTADRLGDAETWKPKKDGKETDLSADSESQLQAPSR
ncbi:hypothetical protein PFICI_05652 [Pestalotiopsis fici W106-1]|uniref:DUF2306 domain-containing protein n=1 Tax=Pestalotiopsis fici (strain W106-1 / CGMCC3.15140) TaxID=1229662 RepID=W3XF21_PESFW|nr:uncharacterized protein PFICI_05652 [Pestalotiopsis fici W106-1]ETS83776.1 hypothetical protein PFICI_05652 [Pestalotiopsis fici W106-1]